MRHRLNSILASLLLSLSTLTSAWTVYAATDSPYRAAGNIIFISSQVPINPATQQVPTQMNEQVKQVFENLKAQVNAAGATLDDVVKLTIYMDDIDLIFPLVKESIPQYFHAPYPARSPIGGLSFGKTGFRLAIDAIVYVKN